MDVLPGAIIEAKLKVAGKKLIFCGVATRRKYAVAAIVGKFKSDNLPLTGVSLLPSSSVRRFTGTAADHRVVFKPARRQIFFRYADDRFGQEPWNCHPTRFGGYLGWSGGSLWLGRGLSFDNR